MALYSNRQPAWAVAAVYLALAVNHPAFARGPDPLVPDAPPATLVTLLGSDDFVVREQAQARLSELGAIAFDDLAAAENHPDLEIASRVEYLIRSLRIVTTEPGDRQEVKSILAGYEGESADSRAVKLGQLTHLPDRTGLVPLARLVRFEPSQKLSREAAMLAIRITSQPPAVTADEEAAVLRALGRSTRAPADWLRTWLLSLRHPQEAVDAWFRLAEAEDALLAAGFVHAERRMVIDLWERQVDLLARASRDSQIAPVLSRLVRLTRNDPAELTRLFDYLARHRGWLAVTEAEKRFSSAIEQNPLLLYTLARARQASGDVAEVDRLVEKARGLSTGSHEARLLVALELWSANLTEWAEAEMKLLLAQAPLDDPAALRARLTLAEWLHDRGEELEAADVLQGVVDGSMKLAQGQPEGVLPQGALPTAELAAIRARVEYFRACAAAPADPALQRVHLDRALTEDPHDIEALIALFRFPGLDDETRSNTMKLIQETVELYRRQIAADPNDHTPYNQLAWLVANTEGDVDEAIRCSKKSLELRPGSASYLDTLGRCYFAKGDLEKAVECQLQAVALEPQMKQMAKQLELFQAALEKSRRGSS